MRRTTRFLLCTAVTVLLTSCELEDDLEIHEDGSGRYRAKVTVERIVRPILERIRAEAERDGFRIVEEGVTFGSRYIVVAKDFQDIRELSGPQSNFDLKIEQVRFRRRFRLRATIASVAGASFERRFTIAMPAKVTSTTAGGFEGRRVTWYCANGGTIDVVAEGFHAPVKPKHVALSLLATAVAGAGVLIGILLFVRRRERITAQPAVIVSDGPVCRTCRGPLSPAARYCSACGDLV